MKRYRDQDNNNDNNNNDISGSNDGDVVAFKKFKNEIAYDQISYRELQSVAGSLNLNRKGRKLDIYRRIEDHLKSKLPLIRESEINNNYSSSSSNSSGNSSSKSKSSGACSNDDTITFKKFKDEIAYDQISYRELQGVARSLKLISSGRKLDVYQRIEDHLKTETTVVKEESDKANNNPFNKDKVQLSIKNVEPVELMFWSIFRNKFLFTRIFSNFVFKYCKSYEDLIGIKYLNDNFSNSTKIIIDKLKSGGYMFYSLQHIKEMISTFKKDTPDNRELYGFIFATYKSTFTSTLQQQKLEFGTTWFSIMVTNNNKFAFNQYINYLNDNNISFDKHKIFDSIQFSDKGNPTFRYKSLKMYRYLKDNNYINDQNRVLNIGSYFNDERNFIFISMPKLKRLVKHYYNIIYLYYNNIDDRVKESFKYNKLISSLNQITLNHFTSDQLNSTIRDLIINSSSPTEQIITISYNSINTNTSSSNSASTTTIDNNNIDNNNNNSSSIDKSNNSSFKLIELIKSYYKILYKIHVDGYYRNKPLAGYLYLSSKEKVLRKLNRFKLAQFENDFINITLRDSKQDQIKYSLSHIRQFSAGGKFIFDSGDFGLISDYIDKVKDSTNFVLPTVLNYITNTNQLDHLFKCYKNKFFADGNENWMYISNLSTLQHYESLMESCSRLFSIKKFTNLLTINIEVLIRALSTPSLYKNNINSPIGSNILSKYNSDDVVRLFSTFGIKQFNLLPFLKTTHHKINYWLFKHVSNDSIIKLLKQTGPSYILEINYKQNNNSITSNITELVSIATTASAEDQSIKCIINDNWDLLSSLQSCGRIDDVIECLQSIPELLNERRLTSEDNNPLSFFSIYSLDKFITFCILNLNSTISDVLYHSLCVAAVKGYVSIFKKIISNYPYVLKVKTNSKSDNFIFKSYLLEYLVQLAFDNYYTNLATLLINFIGFKQTITNQLKKNNEINLSENQQNK